MSEQRTSGEPSAETSARALREELLAKAAEQQATMMAMIEPGIATALPEAYLRLSAVISLRRLADAFESIAKAIGSGLDRGTPHE